MQFRQFALLALGLTITAGGSVRADDKADAKAVVDKAIEAHGGEAELKKLMTSSVKLKGKVHVMGMEIAFMGTALTAGADRHRIDIEVEAGGQKFTVVHVFNKDKGWVKVGDETTEMDKDKVAEAVEEANAGAVISLAPLKDKAYTLALVGDDKVGKTPVTVIRVSRKDRRDVNLFFDKKTHLLLKSEKRVKDEESGEEKNEETLFTVYNDKGLRQAKKISVKRDGKAFLDAEMSDLRVDEKFDEGTFGKP